MRYLEFVSIGKANSRYSFRDLIVTEFVVESVGRFAGFLKIYRSFLGLTPQALRLRLLRRLKDI